MRRSISVTALAVAMCPATASSLRADTPLRTERIASGLDRPVMVTAPPGDTSRLFIVEHYSGRIRILDLETMEILPEPFITIDVDFNLLEKGVVNLAFAPDYADSGRFYVHYTRAGTVVNTLRGLVQVSEAGHLYWEFPASVPITRIGRGTVSSDPNVANPEIEDILTHVQTATFHYGGGLQFGPDGYLYVGLGDGGGQNDPLDRAQNLRLWFGKILRLDVSGETGYEIPHTNPFVGIGLRRWEIWASGLRNPWRFSFDRETGDLYIGDVGQYTWEEIDFQPGSSPGGENYGWRCRDASHEFLDSTTNPCGTCESHTCPWVDPIFELQHPTAKAFIGGHVYRGAAIPSLNGAYVFADNSTNRVYSFRYDGSELTDLVDLTESLTPSEGSFASISSFGEDAAGELYICSWLSGEIHKIVPDVLADFDGDGMVDFRDMLILVAEWGPCPADCTADLDGDADVDFGDLLLLVAQWSQVPVPRATSR